MLIKALLVAAASIVAISFPENARAQSVLLDCELTLHSRTLYFGEPSSETKPSGRWRFRLDPSTSTANLVSLGTVFLSAGGEHPFRNDGRPFPLSTTDDTYSMCLDRTGACNTRRTFPFGDWHELDVARIDRRTGEFSVRENHYIGDLRGGGTHEYRGICTRAPDQQF